MLFESNFRNEIFASYWQIFGELVLFSAADLCEYSGTPEFRPRDAGRDGGVSTERPVSTWGYPRVSVGDNSNREAALAVRSRGRARVRHMLPN